MDSTPNTLPWWRELDRYQWLVFAMATLAWMFDCLDQQLFVVARNPAIAALSPAGTPPEELRRLGGHATAIFVLGWAVGGLIFGALGDRFGRARMLAVTVLLYSVCTGLSAFARGFTDFCVYRFVTGLGVGGVFGLAVALVADTVPDRARPHALGILQTHSTVGNVFAALVTILFGWLETGTLAAGSAWRWLFLVGALPAFLCVFIQLRLREPPKWVAARAAGKATGVRFGSYASLFGEPRWRRHALCGMVLCVSGVVGLWGIGFFSPELVGDVVGRILAAQEVPAAELPGRRMMWTGINMLLQNVGGFAGMLAFTLAAHRFGRKPVFVVAHLAALAATVVVFQTLREPWHVFVLVPCMGFCQFALFAGFAIWLPELFPLRLRSTGTSFCYNVGRLVAASGPFTLGVLQAHLAAGALTAEHKLDSFRDACSWLALVYLLGLVALPFLPETRGRPLPEG
jgi:MFS family permease